MDEREILSGAYRDFNARAIDEVLARLDPNVEWANGMDGGHVHGREAVREYWTRQWKIVDPHVEPVSITKAPDGSHLVEVHQVVRDPAGNLLLDKIVYHHYRIRDGLIQRMDIEEREAVSS